VRFSIITPSFRSSQWLRLCIASVADQTGVEIEHIVQDSCSDDGTAEWLPKDSRVRAFIEKDQGMYDAINRGFKRATGDLLAYLNADEQYLPGALKIVHDHFAAHPDTDVVFADSLVVDARGDYICSRHSLLPKPHQVWLRVPVLTSSLFLRRRVVQEHGLWLDTKWRDIADLFWTQSMMLHSLRIEVLPHFTSVFTDTGENMNLKPNGRRELGLLWQMTPRWVRLFKYGVIAHYRLDLLVRGAFSARPIDYSLYTLASPQKREPRHVAKPTSFWKRRC
jgi:glycosyltransferase involved in cell wall biosynthesis